MEFGDADVGIGSLNAVGVFFFDSRSYVKKTVERDLFGGEGE